MELSLPLWVRTAKVVAGSRCCSKASVCGCPALPEYIVRRPRATFLAIDFAAGDHLEANGTMAIPIASSYKDFDYSSKNPGPSRYFGSSMIVSMTIMMRIESLRR